MNVQPPKCAQYDQRGVVEWSGVEWKGGVEWRGVGSYSVGL